MTGREPEIVEVLQLCCSAGRRSDPYPATCNKRHDIAAKHTCPVFEQGDFRRNPARDLPRTGAPPSTVTSKSFLAARKTPATAERIAACSCSTRCLPPRAG